ncbi:OTU domain, ubiquitin aldehyde binding [Podochytrium sp. JEL0797]|nr:OTU domain, ubiquitin aldehyde binding [Podochytrium sp. JEL0797]
MSSELPEDRPTDQEILAHQKSIQQEFLAAPLVGPLSNFDALIAEYAGGDSEPMKKKTKQLATKAQAMRKVRKDGNCFYRALSFCLCELLLNYQGTEWAKLVKERVMQTRQILIETGYDPIITDDFFEPLGEALADGFNAGKLEEWFEKEYTSDTIVCYLRLVTAGLLKKEADLYEAFILDSYPTLNDFIANQVEPMGIESDQIHIVAMSNALGVTINVANLDSSDADLNFHDITPMMPLELKEGKGAQPVVNLLYRPGHYDIVYL